MSSSPLSDNKSSGNKPIIITLAVVVIVIIVLVAYFMTSAEPEPPMAQEIPIPAVQQPPEPKPDPKPAEPEPQVAVIPDKPEPEPPVEEEPAFVLPLLDGSDQLVRDGVISLTRHEGMNVWLASSELVRKFVAFTDNVAHGQVAKGPVRVLAPEGPFLARPLTDDTFELDTTSYERYNGFTQIAVSVDARRAAEFYQLLKPLFQSAYAELGYGDRNFDDVVFQAIGRLLETPVIEEPIILVRPVVMYKYQDEKLENLSPVQKQLIRMGPDNTRLLQRKISEIALELRAILGR